MQDLFADLFLNNFNLEASLRKFLRSNPEYRRTEKRLIELERQLIEGMPEELEDLLMEYEGTSNALNDMESTGSYLFGLGLRQDLREALWTGAI